VRTVGVLDDFDVALTRMKREWPSSPSRTIQTPAGKSWTMPSLARMACAAGLMPARTGMAVRASRSTGVAAIIDLTIME